MLIAAERFLSSLINKYGKHPVSTEGGGGMWYPPQACKFLKLKEHHIHSPFEKSNVIERTIQYIKDRTNKEGFDDHFPCKRKKNSCKLQHINNGLLYSLTNTIKVSKLTAPINTSL